MGRTKQEKEADCYDCVVCDKVKTGRKRDVLNHVIYMHMETSEASFVCSAGCASSTHPLKGPFRVNNIQKMTNHLKTDEHKMMTKMGLTDDQVLILRVLFENKYSKIFQKYPKNILINLLYYL